MQLNTRARLVIPTTHEGGRAMIHQKPAVELERAVATCLLWENTFYESGNDIAKRIASLCEQVDAATIAKLAIKARTDYKLRHVPLFLGKQLTRLYQGAVVGNTLAQVIQRPDELAEFLAIYWKEKRTPLSAQVKKGLASAFTKFNEYSLAKWNQDGAVKLRDVLFLCHAKPKDEAQAALWKKLVDGQLQTPDTWEVALSSGADKKSTWERLLQENQLGYIALLMNLRNMVQANVDPMLVQAALLRGAVTSKALPFRFVTAAKHAPQFAATLSDAMLLALRGHSLDGNTAVVVDVSGSMDAPISAKSELRRWEAAGALAILLREVTPSCRIFTFSNSLVEVPNYRGLPLIEGITRSQQHGGTALVRSLEQLQRLMPTLDRLVVVTDEQTQDGNGRCWAKHGYIINVAPYKPGLETSGTNWQRINGWSERVVDYMQVYETQFGETN